MEETIRESKNMDSITVFPSLDLTDAGKHYFFTDLWNIEPAVPLHVIFHLSACFKCPTCQLAIAWALLFLTIMMNLDVM